ncbi:MAG: lantibiotic dehydratase family protein [Bacteroidales bacterium]|nr:lantibiotic dehydratase family protein [Bacteroidales bacterium]
MYTAFNDFLLRTPLLPYSQLNNLLQEEEKIIKQYTDPLFQEAIYIASPVLHGELIKFLQGEISDKKEVERLHNSLSRYLSRMSTRCTPFGLLAGCAVGRVEEETNMVLEEGIARKTRFDMYFLCKLSNYLSNQPEIREKIKYYPNSSLYTVGDKYRYIETVYNGSKIQYKISSVKISDYLELIINQAQKGVCFSEIRDLIEEEEISIEEKNMFINELISSSILVSELSPSVTGEDYFTRILSILNSIGYENNHLSKLSEHLQQLDKTSGNAVSVYDEIIETIGLLDIDYKKELLFQVDGVKLNKKITMGNEITRELLSVMQFLNKITPPSGNDTLNYFRKEFYQRYEDAEVPLLEALDPEMGIGYPANSTIGKTSPLFENFILPGREHKKSFQLNGFQLQLLKQLCEVQNSGKKEIVLRDSDILEPQDGKNDLPATLYAIFELINGREGDPLLKLEGFSGVCGANLLTRFAHTNEKIASLVEEIIKKEEELMPNVILAEIAYLPNFRIGNILSRPHNRKYELLYLCFSDLPSEQKIAVSDLLLSVKNGRLVLRSQSLDKEIIPRLTSAHNYYSDQSPIYTFLCDMQPTTRKRTLSFNWGNLDNEFSFYPRVRYNNTILSSAYWMVEVTDIKSFFTIKDEEALLEKVTSWREKLGLPQEILLSDGDNELFVNCSSYCSLQSFFGAIKNRKKIKLTEFSFPTGYQAVKDGKSNIYTNECIVAFHKNIENK